MSESHRAGGNIVVAGCLAVVPQGALISLLQKGLLYSQVEAHLEKDGRERKCIAPFSLLGGHECIVPEDDEEPDQPYVSAPAPTALKATQKKKKKKGSETSAVGAVQGLASTVMPDHHVKVLEGHDSEVGSLWLTLGFCLFLESQLSDAGNRPDGQYLATGSYDGLARVWLRNGDLKAIMKKHVGPIFSLKWNRTGALLLSGGVDKCAIVWDLSTGEARQTFSFHQGPTLDVDWRDDTTFASSSADKKIYVCQLGSLAPLKQFAGHQDEVNSIRWDPSGQFLASCADDRTAKVWTMEKDDPIWDLTAHDKEIYTTRWCPNSDPDKLWLATASFDGGIRLWDIKSGNCLYNLVQHKEAVYTISFTPDCSFLASGSFDKSVYVWSLKDGALLRSYTGQGGVFEISYSPKGDKLAACYSDKKLVVLYVGQENLE
ncbi:Transducin (beta)-like 1 X-linked receptor 1 [Kappamyces sp. JEL0680]|nr:Transducin (beta)-like 1 X-linked receptor 1 [Kappamyces sp. JEL0680]